MSTMVKQPALLLVGVLAATLLPAASLSAQNTTGLYITVPNPITSDAVTHIKSQVNTHLDAQAGRARPTAVIFDFNPEGRAASTPSIGICRDLAQFIQSIKAVTTTVAYVHGKVSGYTALPVLTCKDLLMSKEGLLGEISGAPGDSVDPLQKHDIEVFKFYFGRDDQFVLVQKMFDREIKLRKATNRETQLSQFIDARDPAVAARYFGIKEVLGVQDGQLALYNAQSALAVELCRGIAETRQDIAERYGFTLTTDPLGGRQPEAFRWTLGGEVDGAMRESVKRILREVRRKGGNLLVLTINCAGNDLVTARDIANDLRNAQVDSAEDQRILVVGFIPSAAPSAATVIALGCSDIVMTKLKGDGADAKEAEIGNFESFLRTAKPGDIDPAIASIRELAELQGYPGILIEGMFKKDMAIVRATEKTNKQHTKLMTREDFEKEETKAKWNDDGEIKPKGQLLRLSATKAAEVGLARHLIDSTDARDVALNIYGSKEVSDLEPSWLDQFAEFLKIPTVTVLLVMIGFAGLILELKVPGLTVPGIISALCFILVFWSWSRFSGQTFVLALLLFILGLVLIALEIFVLPGFGACGIFGILCMLAGLGLVTMPRLPHTGREWEKLGWNASLYLFAMIGSVGLAFLIARFLPKVPYANRLILNAPSEGDDPVSVLPGAVEAAELNGAIGTTNTPLRPAGVVRIGEKFVDVVSDGGFIPAGTRVQVIQVEGTRIVVKEV
jgi:membrane-bound serine protease (ClpP class)